MIARIGFDTAEEGLRQICRLTYHPPLPMNERALGSFSAASSSLVARVLQALLARGARDRAVSALAEPESMLPSQSSRPSAPPFGSRAVSLRAGRACFKMLRFKKTSKHPTTYGVTTSIRLFDEIEWICWLQLFRHRRLKNCSCTPNPNSSQQ